MYKTFFKRFVDILVSFIALVLLTPLMLIVTLALAIANRRTPFFLQERPGLYERSFMVIKFKTMSDKRDKNGKLLPDKDRITKLGAFLRKTSIDELPQLINVLTGDMSLIGPRPLLHKYLTLYSEEQKKRHLVRPGITGWAQVNGRNSISWTEKFNLDVYYVDNLSSKLDLKIFWMTILKVLKREGVNQSEARPMEPFNGLN